MPAHSSESLSPADLTRLALVRAGLQLFGQKGFDATSTREIAAAAKTNVASIAYHFGSKEGLREACAQHVVETIRTLAGPGIAAEDVALQKDGNAETMLATAAERMIGIIVARPESGEFVQFLLREVSQPSPALDIIYRGVFEPVHKRLCRLWEAVTGEPADDERTKLSVFTLIGQVVYFRIAREAVKRRMGWDNFGPDEAARITAVALENFGAILRSRRENRGQSRRS